MKTQGSVFASLAATAICMIVLGATFLAPDTAFAGNSKVEVCHVPPGDPDNFHTIKISENALSAHLGHADLGGPCDGNCADLCDDGNACTIDDNGACEDSGCPVPAPVDCDDGNACTVESCDPLTGCDSVPVQCGDGETCNPDTGACEAEVTCPCFDLDTLMTELDNNGGNITTCGDFDGSFFPDVSDGQFILYDNFSLACSGEGGTNCTLIEPLGCGFATGFNGVGWDNVFTSAVTPAEDTECRALLQAVCDMVAGGAPAQSSAAGEGEPASELPPSVIQ